MADRRERTLKQEKLVRSLAERLRFELLLLRRYRTQDSPVAALPSGTPGFGGLAEVLAAAVEREAGYAVRPDGSAEPPITS